MEDDRVLLDDKGYFDRIGDVAESVGCFDARGSVCVDPIEVACCLIKERAAHGGRIYFIGNGGSLAACSHMANDLCLGGIPAMALDSAANVTCVGNDWGFEQAFLRQLMWLWRDEDVLIALSCSGRSANIRLPVEHHKKSTITLTGFDRTNPIMNAGALMNFWAPSSNYGTVQLVHEMILHCIIDRIAGLV